MPAVALFLIGQIFVAAHAIEHGTEPHKHNGVVCLTVLNEERDDLVSPIQSVAVGLVVADSNSFSQSKQVQVIKNLALRPPSTGPPSI